MARLYIVSELKKFNSYFRKNAYVKKVIRRSQLIY